MWVLVLLFIVAVWAGTQNALAGGGSFITLPLLMFTGLDARAANVASTLALFPGQVTTGFFGRSLVSGAANLSFRTLVIISLIGGALGALLLLATPPSFFGHMVPYLVLFATALFAWGSFFRKTGEMAKALGPRAAMTMQFGISLYGGYFGGGIGFLMLAALTMAGLAVRTAGATKNVLASVMNASAVAIFVFTPGIPWLRVAIVCVGAICGGYLGTLALKRVNEKLIRGFVVVIGLCLTVGLFLRQL
jgi:uncharacterized membrane protein YfcA